MLGSRRQSCSLRVHRAQVVSGMICYLCPKNGPLKSGRGERIRTSDPLRPRQVRYQAALRPDRKSGLSHIILAVLDLVPVCRPAHC